MNGVRPAAGAAGGGDIGVVHGHSNVFLRSRGRRQLRNVSEALELFDASCEFSRFGEPLPFDPVCRMAVDPEHEAGRLTHEGVEYHFCSLECARAFAENPDQCASGTTGRMAEGHR